MSNSKQQDIALQRKQEMYGEYPAARMDYRRTGNTDRINASKSKLAALTQDDYVAAAGIDPNYDR